LRIYFDDEGSTTRLMEEIMIKAAELCARREGLDPEKLSLSVSFACKDEIRRLNREYRGKDAVTDVLSFPQFDGFEELNDWGEISLGDVVLCEDKAREQAAEFGHSYERELIYLFVHSVFHLLGYDHMDAEEKSEMREAEEEIMTALGIERKAEVLSESADCDAKALYLEAAAALKNAYAPFSKFKVGAALLGANGKIYTGVNVENSSYGATICAERSACVKAVSDGCREFKALAIASSDGEVLPCGICRQFLFEFCEHLPIIVGEDEEHLRIFDLSELLAEGFRLR